MFWCVFVGCDMDGVRISNGTYVEYRWSISMYYAWMYRNAHAHLLNQQRLTIIVEHCYICLRSTASCYIMQFLESNISSSTSTQRSQCLNTHEHKNRQIDMQQNEQKHKYIQTNNRT